MTLPSLLRLVLRLLLPAALLCTPALAVPPTAPVITSMTWNAANSFNATWQDRSNDEDGFWLVYRTSSSGNYTIHGERARNLTSIAFTPESSFRVCGVIFEWAVVAWKGTGASQEYSFSTTTVELLAPPPTGTPVCPPTFRPVNDFYSSSISIPFSLQTQAYKRNSSTGALIALTTGFSATGLPPGITMSATGNISGAATAAGRFTVTLRAQETGGLLGTRTFKLTVFRPVPAGVAPANGTPLPDHTLQGNAASVAVDLNAHFNDPDVTDASRLVFNMGTIDFLYYSTAAPATVANFKGYISRGDFVDTIIHRSIPGFVLQGGGYKAEAGTPSITRQPPVINEPEITNGTGTVAMAKSGGSPNSATSEFFISLADNSANLNNQNEGFAVFARVPSSGMAVANAIASLCIFNYSAINGVLTNCPLTPPATCLPGEPTPPFDPALLVKMISAGPVAPLSYIVQSSDPLVCEAAVTAAQLALTPLAGGTSTITVTTTDLDNQAITRTFTVTVTVSNQLAAWLAAQNFPNPADATASANPDGDSGENIMEFGLMTDPQSATPVPVPQSGLTTVGASQYLTLTFPVRKQAGSSFLYTVESQDGLTGAWTPVWTSANGFAHAQVVASTDQADRTNVTIRDTAAITAGAPRFVRLRVTDTP